MSGKGACPTDVSREPKVVIPVPSDELMVSLFSRVRSRFPGEKGMRPHPPTYFDVHLVDFPKDASELDEVLEVVQAWLDDVGLESVTVQAEGRSYELRASAAD